MEVVCSEVSNNLYYYDRSQLHDHVQGNMSWPDLYDGRAVVHPCYQDHEAGVSLEENVSKFKTAKDAGDTSRMVTWS